jgi:hypothetical protein
VEFRPLVATSLVADREGVDEALGERVAAGVVAARRVV